jgi:hypothetical protein
VALDGATSEAAETIGVRTHELAGADRYSAGTPVIWLDGPNHRLAVVIEDEGDAVRLRSFNPRSESLESTEHSVKYADVGVLTLVLNAMTMVGRPIAMAKPSYKSLVVGDSKLFMLKLRITLGSHR